MDFEKLFGFGQHDLESYQMVVRAVSVFIIAIVVVRIAGIRSFTSRAPFDVVMGITVGAILSRCITGHYPFFPCILAAITLAVCHRIIGYLTLKFAGVRDVVQGKAAILYSEGNMNTTNQIKFAVNDEDIQKALRENGLEHISLAKSIWYENDGKINVIKKPGCAMARKPTEAATLAQTAKPAIAVAHTRT